MTPSTSPGSSGPDPAAGVILAPRPWLPLGILALGLALLPLQRVWNGAPIAAGVVGVLGLFLLLQTLLLRLQFSDEALLVWSRSRLLRRFPYSDWLGWTVFWGPLPVLFYFRERQSPHLLPVIFDATALRQQLELHLSALP
ncbi:DUF3119 family protein [Synechococcus sp. RedBA-s]|uniref:DUF3119 family protein n=1 Tax=Synechococcus sp. RedBA-s TaxID=2823741 RepID=UPI0020CDABB2|nr:DUF3119 family protein [Synechococcus sp. RedBA-s]MCP9799608.1 DUF3119 family protein [Synechococcus sp. RedBA-s]